MYRVEPDLIPVFRVGSGGDANHVWRRRTQHNIRITIGEPLVLIAVIKRPGITIKARRRFIKNSRHQQHAESSSDEPGGVIRTTCFSDQYLHSAPQNSADAPLVVKIACNFAPFWNSYTAKSPMNYPKALMQR